jgi:hypothetical protein
MSLPDYEKLGVFYLGRELAADGTATGADLLYDSRDLTTHAVCIGMTGSGKTGLCLSLLEEALLDGIPVLAIDPKGDLGNLLLTFPELSATDFAPWVDAGEAARKGVSTDQLAEQTARRWRDGLAQWNEDGDRIRRLRDAAEFTIYTPGSNSGRPISILRSLSAPAGADESALKERIGAAVSGLLALLGIEADPIRSREHILLSALLDSAWRGGASLDLPALIQAVQRPPFEKVGVFDLESFYSAKDRQELALRINALLAAPGFAAWLEGDALDAQRLLYTDSGKPRVSIVSIAHLNDAERMFVVTLVANELVSWMRRQPGTPSLRALFYMDEVFGYFPPTAMPPSKTPLLTLMKQARAFGLGVVLATQNPVDLDYKGLGNAGTWFIGRLQTERDKARVIDGLLGTDAASGLDRDALGRELANLPQRRFLMRNAQDPAPVVFETRWALSYLRGPLTLAEIARLTPRSVPDTVAPAAAPVAARATATAAASGQATIAAPAGGPKPLVPAGLPERFLLRSTDAALQPHVAARVQMHFVDARSGVDTWTTSYYLAPLKGPVVDWTAAESQASAPPFASQPPAQATYADVAGAALSPRTQATWSSQLGDHVYRTAALELFRCDSLKQTSAGGASEGEFRAQLAQTQRERRDAAVAELRARYANKLSALEERQRKATQKLGKERDESSRQNWDTVASVGNVIGGLLGAVLGGRRAAAGKITSAVRSGTRTAGRISKERADIDRAEADAQAIDQQLDALNAELTDEVGKLETQLAPEALQVERLVVRPRKADTAIDELALVWVG